MRLFVVLGDGQQSRLVERPTDDLQANRQAEFDQQVKRAMKPELNIEFIADKDFLTSDNARILRESQKAVRKELARLKELNKCLYGS